MTLLELAAADPHAPAVDDLTRTRSRGELVDRARRVGHWLLDDAGLAAGRATSPSSWATASSWSTC